MPEWESKQLSDTWIWISWLRNNMDRPTSTSPRTQALVAKQRDHASPENFGSIVLTPNLPCFLIRNKDLLINAFCMQSAVRYLHHFERQDVQQRLVQDHQMNSSQPSIQGTQHNWHLVCTCPQKTAPMEFSAHQYVKWAMEQPCSIKWFFMMGRQLVLRRESKIVLKHSLLNNTSTNHIQKWADLNLVSTAAKSKKLQVLICLCPQVRYTWHRNMRVAVQHDATVPSTRPATTPNMNRNNETKQHYTHTFKCRTSRTEDIIKHHHSSNLDLLPVQTNNKPQLSLLSTTSPAAIHQQFQPTTNITPKHRPVFDYPPKVQTFFTRSWWEDTDNFVAWPRTSRNPTSVTCWCSHSIIK